MSTPESAGSLAPEANSARRDWGLALLVGGLLAMYGPTLYRLLDHGLWSNEEHSHGPMIFGICLWLLWERWRTPDANVQAVNARPDLGWPLFALGAITYVAGRALGIIYFELGSLMPVMGGLILLARGPQMLRALRFPLLYMIFMIPIPGFIADPVGQALKPAVSYVADTLLHLAGYPIARAGVTLQIGHYQLLVADACAGMRTLFMLEALGILYLELVHHASWLRNITLALLIIPISFVANVGRVMILCLLTYYFGDEVGQGFLHGFAGIALFVLGLALMILTDILLRMLSKRFSTTQSV